MRKIVLELLAILIVIGLIYLFGFGYPELTKHQITVTVGENQIIPTGKSGDGSAYLISVKDTDRNLIELQRGWYMWGDNIDALYFDLKNRTGQKVTLECYGWVIPSWYWYDMCYKEV